MRLVIAVLYENEKRVMFMNLNSISCCIVQALIFSTCYGKANSIQHNKDLDLPRKWGFKLYRLLLKCVSPKDINYMLKFLG